MIVIRKSETGYHEECGGEVVVVGMTYDMPHLHCSGCSKDVDDEPRRREED